jgi:hypothetical protein
VVVVDTERLGPHSKGKSPVNPWLSETDPVYLASGATTDSKFHEIAFEPYKEISEIFNSVFGTDMFTLKKFMGDVNHEII